MPTAFIIAGFDIHDTAVTDPFFTLEKGLKNKGYTIAASDISWKRKTLSQYASEFELFYQKHKSDKNIVIGNSFGAAVAFVTAAKLAPDTVYLSSLSPFFKEDQGKYSDGYTVGMIGKRRAENFWSISARQVAEQINVAKVKTVVTYGEQEHTTSPPLVARCNDVAKRINASEIHELKDAPHSMGDKTHSLELLKIVS